MKRLLCLFLCLVLVGSLSIPACAYTTEEKYTADALYYLHLFLGMGSDENGDPIYGLDLDLTREQGLLLFLRMIGQADEAEVYTGTHPFTDVKNHYYDPYIGYAYANGLTKGTGASTFDGDMAMSEKMFATFCMRALGYQDGEDADFLYKDAVSFAKSKGVAKTSSHENFDRGDAVMMFWQTLNATCKGQSKTLASVLIGKGVFTSTEFTKAKAIQKHKKSSKNNSTYEYSTFELPEIEI